MRVLLTCVLAVCSSLAWAGDAAVPLLPLPPLPVSFAVQSSSGPPLQPLPHVSRKGSFDLRFVNVGQLVDLLYDDAMHVPHVISSEVLNDSRVVSFQYDSADGDLHGFVKVFLDSLGFKVDTRDGVDFVMPKDASDLKQQPRQSFVYHPRFRSASYLSALVKPLFQGTVNTSSASPLQGSPELASAVTAPVAASAVGASGAVVTSPSNSLPVSSVSAADDLVFIGKESEIAELRKLLPQLDTNPGQVVVRGWVYEVSDTNSTNSAFSIAAHLLDGQIGVSNGSASTDASALTFDAHFLNVAISALNADTRFKEVSDPNVRVVSGQKVSLNVGEQVPTLGSVSYEGTSNTPVQSVVYQDAGVIFEVEPIVLADSVQLQLDEQVSSFVATTSGVNNSPTKNTRELTTTVGLRDNEVVVLGGLVQDSNSQTVTHEGWLPHFLDGKSGAKGRTEILLVLQVQRVDGPRSAL